MDLCFLILPLFFAASLHMIIVKLRWLQGLAVPISEKTFGRNKTWRGIVCMPFLSVAGVFISMSLQARWPAPPALHWPSAWVPLGLYLGLAYVAAELPNSFFKRRIGIPEGKRPERFKFAFVFLDQADSAFGCALVYWLMIPESRSFMIPLLLLSPAIHMGANYLLYLCRIRTEPL